MICYGANNELKWIKNGRLDNLDVQADSVRKM